MQDNRKDSPSYHRNIAPITEKLREILLNQNSLVLEIGSGSGQHAIALSKAFPSMFFQPTDPIEENITSIDAWSSNSQQKGVKRACALDVTQLPWSLPNSHYDVLLCFNVIHISPWNVTECLFEGAAAQMRPQAQLVLYGPFKQDGRHTNESNQAFEMWLKEQDPRYGVRDMADVEKQAELNGFRLRQAHTMPANNFILDFTKNG